MQLIESPVKKNKKSGYQQKLVETTGNQRLTFFDKRVWDIFIHRGEITEVRILKVYGKSRAWGNGFARGAVIGYFDDHCNRRSKRLPKSPV